MREKLLKNKHNRVLLIKPIAKDKNNSSYQANDIEEIQNWYEMDKKQKELDFFFDAF